MAGAQADGTIDDAEGRRWLAALSHKSGLIDGAAEGLGGVAEIKLAGRLLDCKGGLESREGTETRVASGLRGVPAAVACAATG